LVEDIYPLSPMQQGMLFHTLYSPLSGAYFEQLDWNIQGEFDIAAFKRAWQQVFNRHPVLRIAVVWERRDKALQIIFKNVNLPWEEQDWRGFSQRQQNERLEAFLKADRGRGFDLAKPPLIRMTMIRLEDSSYQFIWSFHHLLLDGWSASLVINEAFAIYHGIIEDKAVCPPLPRPYRDYITWLQEQDLSGAERFWRERLKGFTSTTQLTVTRRDQAPALEANYADADAQLSEDMTSRLKALARQHRITLNTIVQAVWGLLLSRYSREADVVFGATASGRPTELTGVDAMIGLFLNTLPVRVKVDESESIVKFLQALQRQQTQQMQYEYSPLVEVQGWSEVPRGEPLFESILVFENYPVNKSSLKANSGLRIVKGRILEKTNYPITVTAVPGARMSLRISYDTGKFKDTAVSRMLSHVEVMLSSIASGKYERLWQLPMLNPEEAHQVLIEWNDTSRQYAGPLCIHEPFERQAKQTPQNIAVIIESQQITYAELNTRANQLAYYLRLRGVRAEKLVAICLHKSIEMVVAMLAVLKAGAAYVPIDPDYPKQRLDYLIENTGPCLLLTQQSILERKRIKAANAVCVDRIWQSLDGYGTENLSTEVSPHNLAYVIYTSGSTGTPKGAMNDHLAIYNRQMWMQEEYKLDESDRVLQFSSFSFDFSVWEILGPLSAGAAVVMPKAGWEKDISYLVEVIIEKEVTMVHFVPTVLQVFLQEEGASRCKRLRRVFSGGEALSVSVQEEFFRVMESELHNQYGPTETAIDVTYWDCERGGDRRVVPIGRPNANNRIYILDREMRGAAIGVEGELYIGGMAVGRGYLNEPGMTAEKFLPDPFGKQAGARMYKTGDLCRYEEGGEIEYLGRVDEQVKLRGYRIELGEVEAALNEHEGVTGSVVVMREDQPGHKRLVAYVTTHPRQDLSADHLHSFLKQRLPEYMIPSAFEMLEALPLTQIGKLDRRALPVPRNELNGRQESPRTPIEEILAGIWSQVLRVDEVGVYDNFFRLGGHSILATQAISRMRKAFRVEIPLKILFESPTIAELAVSLRPVLRGENQLQSSVIEPAPRGGDLPLSFAQQRIWFLYQLDPGNFAYHIPVALRLVGNLDVAALRQSLTEIVKRHEVLRSRYVGRDGLPIQAIDSSPTMFLPVIDLSELPHQEQEHEARRLIVEEQQRPFDLASGPLLRAGVIHLGEGEHVLLVTMHHIVSDGWSIGIFNRELSTLYEAFSKGHPSPLPDLHIQYADFAIWQRRWLQGEVLKKQIDYWKKQLASAPALDLPTDLPRPEAQTYQGGRGTIVLSRPLSDALKTLSRREGVTLFMTLSAGFGVALNYFTRRDDLVVGTNVANRNRVELEPLIGFFINQLALRLDLSGDPSFQELLHRVREVTLSAYDHQDLPFERVIDELNIKRDASRPPLLQVVVSLQNAPMQALKFSGLNMEYLSGHMEAPKFELLLDIDDTKQGLVASMEYRTDLFLPATIVRLLEHFQAILDAVAGQPALKLSALKERLAQYDTRQEAEKVTELKKAVREKLHVTKRRSLAIS